MKQEDRLKIEELLWKVHHKAYEDGDKLLLSMTDVALALCQERSAEQVLMIMETHNIIRYIDTGEFIMPYEDD